MPTLRSRTALAAVALACGVAGCGGDERDYANRPRPPVPINVTAAVTDGRISISPKSFGAGPIVIIVSNQTAKRQTLTIETQELGGSQPGLRQSASVGPNGTGTLKVDVRKGTYEVSTRDRAIEPVTLEVGDRRPSAQDELLQP